METDLRQHSQLLRRWWWLLSIGAILPMVISGFLLAQQARLYRATTVLVVGSVLQNLNPNSSAFEASVNVARVYADLVRRPLVMQPVIDRLQLPASTADLAARVTAVVRPDAQVLEVSVIDTDPQTAQTIANAAADALIQQTPASRQDIQGQLAFVQQQLEDLQQSISDLETRQQTVSASLSQKTSAADIEKAQQEISTLRAMLDNQRTTYARMLEMYQGGMGANALTIVELAAPGAPLSQHLPLALVAAGLAGLVVAACGIVLSEMIGTGSMPQGRA